LGISPVIGALIPILIAFGAPHVQGEKSNPTTRVKTTKKRPLRMSTSFLIL